MNKRYIVELTQEERCVLREMVSSGKAKARKLAHARILLKADSSPKGSAWPDRKISQALDVGVVTVERVRKRFVEEGFEAALNNRKPNREYKHCLDGDGEAHLIALTCSKAPKGYQRWTLQLLAGRMVQLGYVDAISYETVRRALKKTNLSLG
jgi:transposase